MITLRELAEISGGELHGNPDAEITGAAALEDAGDGDVTFLASRKSLPASGKCGATALIVPTGVELAGRNTIAVKNPRLAFARALALLRPRPKPEAGVSDRAYIAENAFLGEAVSVAPFAFIESGARIGNNTILYPGVYVGHGAFIGNDCVLHPNVVVMDGCRLGNRVVLHAGCVVGSDGFGYATDGGVHHKIPQAGIVVIEDDVEIGANAAIDRATVGQTVIGRGTKLDNLVQVAHNVRLGSGCLIAALGGVAGSSTLGDYVVMGGMVGVADHVKVGDRVMMGGHSGIASDVEPGKIVSGIPAFGHRDWLRSNLVFQRLPELERRLRA
ncbi:MAG: UDP-3-O-(3-hydroxymyristoyl)glucosamine N-acyltransferase, partial [Nitrospirae bacterium]|nr:UDP-3-O-(3-hydroxymyristoyl)glucosamine N-acyltransferase [Nitrospirota bacterium]